MLTCSLIAGWGIGRRHTWGASRYDFDFARAGAARRIAQGRHVHGRRRRTGFRNRPGAGDARRPPGSPPGFDPVANAVDTANTRPYWVGLAIRNEAGNSGGTCTGLLINPRTVLFAAHCVDGLAPAAYDGNAPGNRAQVGYTTDPTFGRTNMREWLFGQDFAVPAGDARVMDASSVMVWYDPRSRNGSANDPNNGTFLPADIALAGFGTATELLGRDAQSGIGLLFTPVAGLVPVTIGGYGTSGNGFTGARTGSVEAAYFRRLGQNLLGFLGDERTIALGIYPAPTADLLQDPAYSYQDLYWMDFDDPQRATRPFFNGPGGDPMCGGYNCRLDHDPFPGNAVTGESITGSGDSGSPLVTSAFGREVSLGVLSQGSRFFYESIGNPNDNFVRYTDFSNFGTISGYNPLFLFWDQIVVNNPYKYVAAVAGNGEWTDAAHWVQEIDPLYYTLSGSTLTNALPGTPALGSSDAAPNVGTINPSPSPAAACAFTNTCPPTGGTSDPAPGLANTALPGTQGFASGITLEDLTPAAATPGYEFRIADASANTASTDQLIAGAPANVETVDGTIPGTPASEPLTTALWSSGTLIPVSTGALTGPGTTGFTPNNTLGTPGLQNSTRWFEVNLRAAGTTFLTGATVTIDRLSVRGASAGLNIRSGATLNTVISSFVDAGSLTVNGTFSPLRLTVGGGSLYGAGSIVTTATSGAGLLVNGGVLSPGSAAATAGTLAVTGNTAFTLAGVFGVDVASAASADRLNVTGQLQLGGGFAANTISGFFPAFGNSWTVASATGGITGSFAAVATNFPGVLRPQLQTVGNNLILSVIALPFSSAASYTSAEQIEMARGLDLIRTSGGAPSLSNLFASVDITPTGSLPAIMEALSPLNMFMAGGLTESSSSQIADSILDRGEQLAGGGGHGFQTAGLEMLGLGPQLASADPYEAMMMGAAAVAAAQEAAAETAGSMNALQLKEGWGGFFDLSGIVDGAYEVTPFAGESDVTGVNGTLGFDYSFADDQAFIGGALSYQTGKAELGGVANQRVEADSFGLNVYGGVREGGSFLTGYVGFSAQAYDLWREAPLMIGSQFLTATPDGHTWIAGAKMGFDVDVGNGTITPHVGIDAMWISIDGYTETGGSAAMIAPDRTTALIDGRIGVTYKGLYDVGEGSMLRPKLTVAYVTDVQSDDNVVTTSFLGFPSVPMTFVGAERDNGWVEYEAGLEYEATNFGLALSYTGADNGPLKYGVVSGRVSFAW